MSFDRVAEIYDKTRSLPDEVMKKLMGTLVIELKSWKRILDVGAGTGRFAQPLQNAGFEVVGIDMSKRMIDKAKEKGVKEMLLADARSLPFRPSAFDAVISVHVLHLIPDWKKALQEMCRVTRCAMFSVDSTLENPVREAYGRLLKSYGYERHRLGKSEPELNESLCPAESFFVASYDVPADSILVNLEQRTSSSQWEIPENVNAKVVEELKTKFAGKIFKQELRLLVWDIDSLEACAHRL